MSPRRQDLLRYVVAETLAGRGDRLKGFTVALAVFGRDESFDQQSDPVVRVEARRLRGDLDSYYVNGGSRDPVRITVPKGGYVPHFGWHVRDAQAQPLPSELCPSAAPPLPDQDAPVDASILPGPAAEMPRRRPIMPIALLLAAIVLAFIGYSLVWPRGTGSTVPDARGPAVIVLSFEAPSDGGDAALIASGMTQELIAGLMRFPDFRLYSTQASLQQDSTADPVGLGRDLGVTYVVKGSVQSAAGKMRLAAQLADARNGKVLWTGSYDRALSPGALLDVQRELAAAIATELGEPFGVVNAATAWRLTQSDAPSMNSYACILRSYEYRRTLKHALFAPALACLEEAVVRDPDYADAWAMLGWFHLYAVREHMVPATEHAAHLVAAVSAATRAVDLDPRSQRGLEALSAITFYKGDYTEAERLQRQALALNPYDPDTLAQLGWRLAVRGDWDNGLPLLNKAIARSASPPGWYFHLISVHEYLEGNYAAALAAAKRSSTFGSPVGLSLAAISHAKLGDMDAARHDLAAMAEGWPLLARDPAAAYASYRPTDQIVASLVDGLRAAGLKEPDWPE